MTRGLNGRGRLDDAAEPLTVVGVDDVVEPKLAARRGAVYESPPQPRQQAMALVALLLGHVGEVPDGDGRWVAPIAGGRRVVTITEEPGRGGPRDARGAGSSGWRRWTPGCGRRVQRPTSRPSPPRH